MLFKSTFSMSVQSVELPLRFRVGNSNKRSIRIHFRRLFTFFYWIYFDSLCRHLPTCTASISIIVFSFFSPDLLYDDICLHRHPKNSAAGLLLFAVWLLTSDGLRDVSPNSDNRFKDYTESLSLLIWFPRNSMLEYHVWNINLRSMSYSRRMTLLTQELTNVLRVSLRAPLLLNSLFKCLLLIDIFVS
jgi:hypothetical protein